MKNAKFVLPLIIVLSCVNIISVYAQQPQLATFHEIASIIVDQEFQHRITASISLATSSSQEIHIPPELDQKIHNIANVTSVIVTNAHPCVFGVGAVISTNPLRVNQDFSCVIITLYEPGLLESYNITKVQSQSKIIGDTLIGDINKALGLNAEFNSAFINSPAQSNTVLGTTMGTAGEVTGNRTISVVYTMPPSNTGYMYEGLYGILLAKQIRDGGGFFDVSKKMADDPNSTATLAIIPKNNFSIYELQVIRNIPIKNSVTTISPADIFGVETLDRSSYFSAGFFPLNSILQVVVLANQSMSISNHGGNLVPTVENNGGKIPTDLSKAGWLFDPDSGNQIVARYLYGTTFSAAKNDLMLSIGNGTSTPFINQSQTNSTQTKSTITDYSTYVLIGIVAAAIIAIYIYLKKR